MRSENEIKSLLLDVANSDDRIRAVILNGSRANPKAEKDIFQDYDILFMVKEMATFISDPNWIDIFGKRLILQIPEEMIVSEGEKDTGCEFHYLMLLEDDNRIDLTLFPIEKMEDKYIADSLSMLLLDKDHLFQNFPPSSDDDYLIKKPAEKEFLDCCNEFWWVSTYVAKGLYRNEITYAKDMFENPVRDMFLKMIEWHIGVNTNFSVSFGRSGKNIKVNIASPLWDRILKTYPNAMPGDIWNSLFLMTDLFRELATEIAEKLQFNYNSSEDENITHYLKRVKALVK